MPSDVEAVVKAVDGQYQEWLATLGELVRIPSVSGDPAHAVDVERSADAVAAALEVAGPPHARQRGRDRPPPHRLRGGGRPGGAPTVPLSRHPHVQPPGVRAEWTSPP